MSAAATITNVIASIHTPCEASRAAARDLQDRLTKPTGALGRLEELHVWAAGVFRDATPALPHKTIVVAAGDHAVASTGVAGTGVSAYPQDVTQQMVHNFLAGGAAVNALAAHAGADVRVVDSGVLADIDDPRLHFAKLRRSCDDISRGPAMPREVPRLPVREPAPRVAARCVPP